jgi:NAD+ diphosphatase
LPPTGRTALDRASHLRRDPAAVSALQHHPEARALVVIGEKIALEPSADRRIARVLWLPLGDLARFGIDPAAPLLLLGTEAGAGRFAVSLDEAHAEAMKPAVDYRTLLAQGSMSADDLATVALAKSLLHWRSRSRFCGVCGAPMEVRDGGWRRLCTGCAAEAFPRVDPVVMMLVTDGERALLARSPHFPPNMYATLAGFVEPGEDIAGAVRRETREEVGLDVAEVRLVADAPWPLPHSLILACVARIVDPGQLLCLSSGEIEAARWCGRPEVEAMRTSSHPDGLWLPPANGLSGTLIRHWLGDTATSPLD